MEKIVNITFNITSPLTTEQLQEWLALCNGKPLEPKSTDSKPRDINDAYSFCRRHFYNNGAHAGNIDYRIESWGMNSLKVEAEIKKHLDEFIAQFQISGMDLTNT